MDIDISIPLYLHNYTYHVKYFCKKCANNYVLEEYDERENRKRELEEMLRVHGFLKIMNYVINI